MDERPAWSSQFAPDTLQSLSPIPPLDELTPEWAWGESAGRGVRVAVIDSGIDADHPAVGGVQGYVAIAEGPGGLAYSIEPHADAYGHGTACAGIIRALAPECELYSVKVLGARLTGRGVVFAAGIRWALEHGMRVCNVSMGSTKRELAALFHELTDQAYFENVAVVTAANNMPIPSFPSLFASVFSVASHDEHDPHRFYYNPTPPVEFGAPGIDVHVAWTGGDWITATSNSFAAPYITGVITKILGKHPELTVFQLKTVLRALSANLAR